MEHVEWTNQLPIFLIRSLPIGGNLVRGSGTIKISLEFVVGSGFWFSRIYTGFHVHQIFWWVKTVCAFSDKFIMNSILNQGHRATRCTISMGRFCDERVNALTTLPATLQFPRFYVLKFEEGNKYEGYLPKSFVTRKRSGPFRLRVQ